MAKEKKLRFIQGEQNTDEQHNVNSEIISLACELSNELTEKECRKKKIKCLIETKQEVRYTSKAQDIFNEHYDQKMDEIYAVANTIKGKVTYNKLYNSVKKQK